MNTVGQRIKEAREKRKLTEEKIAAKLEIDTELFRKWENDISEPDTQTAIRLAKILGISTEMLLYGADARQAPSAMFPNNAEVGASVLSDWKILVGGLAMLAGAGGAVFMILSAMSEGFTSLKSIFNYCGTSLAVFGAIFALGLAVCAATLVSSHRKRNKRGN